MVMSLVIRATGSSALYSLCLLFVLGVDKLDIFQTTDLIRLTSTQVMFRVRKASRGSVRGKRGEDLSQHTVIHGSSFTVIS